VGDCGAAGGALVWGGGGPHLMALGDIAARLGYPVFPCKADKRPLDKGGFHTATPDQKTILAAFKRDNAALIGVPTGVPSGLIVVDVDIRAEYSGMDWLDENREALPETRTHKTQSGGLHLVFQKPDGVSIRNSAGKVAVGVDVRGEGGYVIFPPSPGYSVADDSPPAPMPIWLIRACCTPEPEQPPAAPRESVQSGGSTKYGLAALENESNAVRNASFGKQELTLNQAALKIGALIAGGQLVESVATSELIAAGNSLGTEPGKRPWTASEIEEKVKRGIADGKGTPRAPKEWTNGHTRHPEPEPEPIPHEAEAPKEEPSFTGEEQPPLTVVYFDEIFPKLGVADFVEGLLIEAAMSVIYGQSNSGKTFFMSDLALHVAAAKPWCGRDIAQGAVIWLAMEGAYGISNRIAAWREDKGLDAYSLPFAVIPTALNLLNPEADTENLIKTIRIVAAKLKLPVKLVVVDTLSRAIAGGNENSPEDMGALVTNGTKIQQATGAHVAWIHHSGKDEAKGARGHSLLRAASDTEIEISAEGAQRVARVTKQRDMECVGEFPFALRVVELGTNQRGKTVTSCVVVHSQETAGAAIPVTRLRGHCKRALEVLIDAIASSGIAGIPGTPGGVLSVPDKWWRERFYERSMPAENQETKQKAFRRASQDLINDRIVGLNAGRVWVCAHVNRPGHSTGQETGHDE
jgi:hypothetical protein